MKLKLVLGCVIAFAGVFLFLYSERISARFFLTANSEQAAPQIPTHILYESLFRTDIALRRKAEEQELSGQAATSLKHYFRDEASLTDEQEKMLEQVAIEYLEEITPVHNQAVQIMANYRNQFPDGIVPTGQEIPPPPAELGTLQAERNTIVMNNRQKLLNLLGASKGSELDSFVHQNFAANFQAIGPVPQH